jgi:hypothetical protein
VREVRSDGIANEAKSGKLRDRVGFPPMETVKRISNYERRTITKIWMALKIFVIY